MHGVTRTTDGRRRRFRRLEPPRLPASQARQPFQVHGCGRRCRALRFDTVAAAIAVHLVARKRS